MKIISLKNIKTEALLIYLINICQEYLENKESRVDLGKEFFNNEIEKAINFLSLNVSKTTLNDYELRSFVQNFYHHNTKIKLPYAYRALVFYYNSLIAEFENNSNFKDKLIPEALIFFLLSEWFLEEEISSVEYPYLEKIDTIKLLGYFEIVRNSEKNGDLKDNLKVMFTISSKVIKKLKNAKFKIKQ